MWSYERGTWQYDIIVALILAFIFFTPPGFFNTERIDRRILAYSQPEVAGPPILGEKGRVLDERGGEAPATAPRPAPTSRR